MNRIIKTVNTSSTTASMAKASSAKALARAGPSFSSRWAKIGTKPAEKAPSAKKAAKTKLGSWKAMKKGIGHGSGAPGTSAVRISRAKPVMRLSMV